jgi:hypothetical protein
MVVESFSRKMIASRLFNTYVAASFFATMIFFVLNSSVYTPFEMILGVVIVTIAFKSVANLMLSMTISLVNLENTEDSIAFEKSSTKLESLVNDLAIQEAAVQSAKNNKNK